MTKEQEARIAELYKKYMETLRLLIIKVDSEAQKAMKQVMYELRDFNDHIARCYCSDEDVDTNISDAAGHLNRAILDCYKVLAVVRHESVETFIKVNRRVDFKSIDDGDFYHKYKNLLAVAEKLFDAAKNAEVPGKGNTVYDNYEKAQNAYDELAKYINEHTPKIKLAKLKADIKMPVTLLIGVLTGVIGNIIFAAFFK